MRILKLHYVFSLIALVSLLLSCQQQPATKHHIIATAGQKDIDWDFLQRSFELNPKWGKGITRQQAYLNQLNYLVDEKLFSLAALSEHLEQDSSISGILRFTHQKEMIKELYRREVADHIEISEQEFQTAYQQLKKKIRFDYVFTPSLENAWHYREQLRHSDIPEISLLDPRLETTGTSPYFTFGEMTPQLEKVVFNISPGEVADPVSIDRGYLVVRLLDGKVEKFQSEMDYAEKKSKIHKIIFDRKAGKIANTYIKDIMQDKNVKLNEPVFFALSDQLSTIIEDKVTENALPIYVSNEEIRTARKNLSGLSDQVLVTYQNGEMTVGEFLQELWVMPADLRPRVKMSLQLKNAIGVMVRNKYLVEQAARMGLDDCPEVARETEIQSDQVLARRWLEMQKMNLNVSEQDVINFMGTENFQQLRHRSGQQLTPDQIRDVLLDLQFTKFKIRTADSLRTVYGVMIDSTALQNLMTQPQDTIRQDPFHFVVRELFY